jgi:trans-aconitate methyltransferase
MALPRDYDANPGRFRLGARVTARYLTGGEGIYAHSAGMPGRTGTHLIADIGCGEAALAAASRSPQMRIVGIDASPVMLAGCPGPRVQADARRLPFASGSFDAAVTANMLYHFLTRMRVSGMTMAELRRYVALADQGPGTEPERREMMLAHRDRIRQRLRELTLALEATEYKIAAYGGTPGDCFILNHDDATTTGGN